MKEGSISLMKNILEEVHDAAICVSTLEGSCQEGMVVGKSSSEILSVSRFACSMFELGLDLLDKTSKDSIAPLLEFSKG